MAVSDFFKKVFGSFSPPTDFSREGIVDAIQKNEANMIPDKYGEMYKNNLLVASETVHNNLTGGDSILVAGASGYTSNAKLYSEMMKGAMSKKTLSDKLAVIRDYDYVDSILRDLATDVLTRSFDNSQSEFFVFTSRKSSKIDDNEDLDKKVNQDLKSLKIYDMLFEIIEDLLFEGQYIFKMDYTNNELDDSLDQNNTIPAYSKSKMVKIFDNQESILRDPANYLVFSIFSSHKKMTVKTESGSYYYLKMPRGIIPESLISKIMNLKILESLQPLVEIQAIDEKMYFHIKFPPGKSATEAYTECRNYEKLIKTMLNMDRDYSNMNVETILDRISSVKVIPLFGNQEEMTPHSVNKVNRIDLDQIKDLRSSISNSLKINIDNQNDTNAEYYKLIKRVRGQLRISVSEFLINYISQRYSIDLEIEDFDLKVPEVQGAEDLDTIDYINLHQSTYNNILDLLQNTVKAVNTLVASPLIDAQALINSYSDQMQKVTGSRILKNFQVLNETSPEYLTNPPPPEEE